MALEQVIYNLEEVKGFSDEELYQRLCESWGITNGKLAVWGKILNGPDSDSRMNRHGFNRHLRVI